MTVVRGRGRLAGGRALGPPIRPGLLPLLLIAAGLFAWWLWPSGSHSAVAAYVPTPIPGTRPLPIPLTTTLVIDESGSTSNTDPSGRRHTESVQIARWMARYSGDRRDALGVVQFANSAVGYGPVPVAAATTMLTTAFAQRPNIGQGT